jgi:outer membrane biosynthesis protein TonB
MRYGTALLLIAAGAIAAYAVTWSPTFIDVQTAGQIVMLVGVLGLGVTLVVDLAPYRAARRASRPPEPRPAREPEPPWPVVGRPEADRHDQPTRKLPRR